MSESIGPMLRRLRERAGRSQDDQADELSRISGRAVERGEVSRWEREVRLLTPWWQEHHALSFGVPTAEIRRAVAVARTRRRQEANTSRGSGSGRAWLDAVLREGPAPLPEIPAAITLEEGQRLAVHAHRYYQAARYRELATILPPLTTAAAGLVDEVAVGRRRDAFRLQASVEAVAAKLATKIGHGPAAWRSANRAREAAQHADDRHAAASAAYQMVCAALRTDRAPLAERMAVDAAVDVVGVTPSSLSWRGALTLIGAIMAARRHDAAEAHDRLDHAQRLAEQLGNDGNVGWTAFGPTNVQIHRMSAATELNDPVGVLAVADRLEAAEIPAELRGRQAQVRLNSAWANMQLNEDPFALINLLDAERVAPELVYSSPTARDLIRDLCSRERRHAMPGLRGLAARAGFDE